MDTGKLYLDLIKKCLVNSIYPDPPVDPWSHNTYDQAKRENGLDWPSLAHTMIGNKRLENLEYCCKDVIEKKVLGDFIECGVWRGGATILMRAILKAYQDTNRQVWVADSFEGLPAPDAENYPDDANDQHHAFSPLSISLEEVQENFRKYDLLDSQVSFLKGWFKDTLPDSQVEEISVLRADGDMYESTIQILENLYKKVSKGGYIIIDDYHAVPACRKAVTAFRDQLSIHDEIKEIDNIGVFWQKS